MYLLQLYQRISMMGASDKNTFEDRIYLTNRFLFYTKE